MLRVFANYHYDPFALYYFAFVANFLYGWFDFHFYTIPFLFLPPCDPTLGEVVYRYLDRYLITGQNPDIIHPQLARYMRGHDMTVGQLDLKGGVGQRLNYRSFKLHYVVLSQNNPPKSLI